MTKHMPLEQRFPNDKATVEWLKSQNKNTRKSYKSTWHWFLEFTGMTGTQIIEDRKQDKEHKWEKKTLEFGKWALTHTCQKHKKPLSEGGIKTSIGTIRGFFNYHYLDLKFRNAVKKRLSKKPRRVREDYKLSKETIARMSVAANIRDRYILVVGKSLGLRAIDFIGLEIGDFTSLNLDVEAPISMGERHTVKEDVPAFPFLDSDAIPIVKAYLGTLNVSEARARMLRIKKDELTTVLQRLAKRANINIGNKHLRFHCLRKFLIDRLSSVMSESKWKQIVGKTVSEDAYVSDLELRKNYAKAMPETTFSNHNHSAMQLEAIEREFGARDEVRKRDIETLKNENETRKTEITTILSWINTERELMRGMTPTQLKEYVKRQTKFEG